MDGFIPLDLFDDETGSAAESEKPDVLAEEVTEEAPAAPEDGEAEEAENPAAGEPEAAGEAEPEEEAPNKADPCAEKLDLLLEAEKRIEEQIVSLGALFDARIMHTDHEEKIIDQMHKELQKYKDDLYAQLIRPILLDIIEMRDSIMRISASYLAKPEGEQDIPNRTFSDYAYDLQDILEKNSVQIYRSETGDDFTPIKQRIIKKVPTDDASLQGKVAESLSCGYSYNGRIISAEKITVFYYEEPKINNENSEVTENG